MCKRLLGKKKKKSTPRGAAHKPLRTFCQLEINLYVLTQKQDVEAKQVRLKKDSVSPGVTTHTARTDAASAL